MASPQTDEAERPPWAHRSDLEHKLDAAGWGLFLIWVGAAFLFGIPVGIGLLGIGILTLGMQLLRRSLGLTLEWFWVVVGLLFLVGGIWELAQIEQPLVPILLILAGGAVLISGFAGKKAIWKRSSDGDESR